MTPTTQPSQAARELYRAILSLAGDNLARRQKGEPIVDGFELIARFERDTEKRVRESLAGEANVERVALEKIARIIGNKEGPLTLREEDARRIALATLATLERTTVRNG